MGRTRIVATWDDRSKNVVLTDAIIDDLGKGYDTGDDAPFYTMSENRFPRDGKTYEPAFLLTGERPRPGMNPRAELARMIASHPQFARATANLIWGKLMTVGFVEPYDAFDLDRSDPANPPPKPWTVQPTNPELLNALAEDFRTHNFSIHRLMKTILKSSAYQLSVYMPGEWKDSYTPYYARKFVRVLTGPEVVDAIAEATTAPVRFQLAGVEVSRVKSLSSPGDVGGRRRAGAAAEQRFGFGEGPDVSSLMQSFFQSNRQTPAVTGNKATTLQTILMMSSPLVNKRVLAANGTRVQQLVESAKTNEEVIEELYLGTLARWPTPEERGFLLGAFTNDRKSAAENLQWSLLNGIEFLLNR
jgi:hypothetical protein